MDFSTLTDEDLDTLRIDVLTEQERRANLTRIPEQTATLNATFLRAEGTVSGQAWRAPTGAHDAYPLDWTVTHNGKTWVSLTPFNVWEPGVSGWREQVAEGYPTWVQPTGAHDAYNTGDRVTFNGADYESLINANTWSPTDYPAGWKIL